MEVKVELTEEIEEKIKEVGKDFEKYGIYGGVNDGRIYVDGQEVRYETCGGYEYVVRDETLRFSGVRQSLRDGSRFINIYLDHDYANVVVHHGEDYSEANQKRVFEGLDYTVYSKNPLTLPFYFTEFTGYEVGMTKQQRQRYRELLEENEDEYPVSILVYEAGENEFKFDPAVNQIRNSNIVYVGT